MIRSKNLGKNVYLVGIKGAGMAGLAQILQGLGYNVQGSDIQDSFFTDAILKEKGIEVHEDFDPAHIPQDVDWAVSSSAYFQKNAEVEELKRRNVPVVSYAEALGYFFNKAFGIAVTGTHGKSTTAAMIAYVLEQGGKDPFALIGAELLNWKSNARIPEKTENRKLETRNYFVIEADEYREQFLSYKPKVLVITNIDYDHSDYFPTRDAYQTAFVKFKKQLKPKGFTVEPQLDETQPHISLQVIGIHNQQNARVAYETCKKLGLAHDTIINALKTFKGLRRRLETKGEYNGAVIIDDYAHHPQEVTASLSSLAQAHPRSKLLVLFHPHTYSRTQLFLKEFAKALRIADEVYLLDIYGSAREAKGEISSDNLVEELQNEGRDALNLHTIDQATTYLKDHLNQGDVLVTMGAGDVFRVAQQLTI